MQGDENVGKRMENDDIITNNEMMEKILGIMNNNDLPLSSKIEFLENKKVPATEILSIIKNTSSIVESPHSWSSNSSTWINVFSWATVVGAGLLTYYLSSEDEIMNEVFIFLINNRNIYNGSDYYCFYHYC